MKKFYECPHCGTEILEAASCPTCEGKGFTINKSTISQAKFTCDDCNGTGKSNNYYCPHCDWSHEE